MRERARASRCGLSRPCPTSFSNLPRRTACRRRWRQRAGCRRPRRGPSLARLLLAFQKAADERHVVGNLAERLLEIVEAGIAVVKALLYVANLHETPAEAEKEQHEEDAERPSGRNRVNCKLLHRLNSQKLRLQQRAHPLLRVPCRSGA